MNERDGTLLRKNHFHIISRGRRIQEKNGLRERQSALQAVVNALLLSRSTLLKRENEEEAHDGQNRWVDWMGLNKTVASVCCGLLSSTEGGREMGRREGGNERKRYQHWMGEGRSV